MKEIKVDVKNEKELLLLFEELQFKTQKKTAIEALKKSAEIIKRQILVNFQGVEQHFSKSNYSNITKTFKIQAMYKLLGVKVGYQGTEAYKTHWIEWGADNAFGTMKGSKEGRYSGRHSMYKTYHGIQPPRPFFFRAVEIKKVEANNSLQDNLVKSMEKLVVKYGGQS